MIVWTTGSGDTGCEDTRARAADAATTSALAWLHTHHPDRPGWHGPADHAITVCVDDTDTTLTPAYDRRGHYDPDATTRNAHQLRDQLTDPLPQHAERVSST